MRTILVTLALLAAVPAAAQHQHGADPDHAAHGGGQQSFPNGWTARLDRANASLDDARFVAMSGGYHAVLGPAGIFYNPANRGTGSYHAQASFTQNRLSQHPEGYGLFVGGMRLNAADQDYLYFIVRQDGKFMVKHRAGAETHTLFDWTEHAAIRRPDAQGRATNVLAVEATPAGARFLVNGQEVAKLDAPQLNTSGTVGLRLNHNIDVGITGFRVQRI